MQCSIDPFASIACQTADNCDKSYSRMVESDSYCSLKQDFTEFFKA